MPDNQIGNTRRVVFTAMALVMFWVATYQFYWLGYETAYSINGWLGYVVDLSNEHGRPSTAGAYWWVVACIFCVAGSFTLIPTGLIALSHRYNVLKVRELGVILVGLLLFTTLALTLFRGNQDAVNGIVTGLLLRDSHAADNFPALVSCVLAPWLEKAARDSYVVSWPRLLPPIILTTAFVVYGAWRGAVRDGQNPTEDEGATAVEPTA